MSKVFSCPDKHPWRMYKKSESLPIIKKSDDAKDMDLFNVLSSLYEDKNCFVFHSKKNVEFMYAKNNNFEIIITQKRALFKRKS